MKRLISILGTDESAKQDRLAAVAAALGQTAPAPKSASDLIARINAMRNNK